MGQVEDVSLERWKTSLEGKGPKGSGLLGNQLLKKQKSKKDLICTVDSFLWCTYSHLILSYQ